MGKTLAASLVCLFAASVATFVRAEEKPVAQDPFGEYEEAKVVTEEGADDPFGEFGSGARGRGRGTGLEKAENQIASDSSDSAELEKGTYGDDPFVGGAERRRMRELVSRSRIGGVGRVAVEASTGPGTFTVVSGDKRSILLNTTTGETWQLMIDNPGSHWEPIAKGVSKGGKTEISWSAVPAGAADVQPAADADLITMPRSLLTTYENTLANRLSTITSLKQRNKELVKIVAETNEKNADLKNFAAEAEQRNEELEKQLKEAKDALKARDKEVQADVVDASQVK
jgi:hypothetical protein